MFHLKLYGVIVKIFSVAYDVLQLYSHAINFR